LCGAPAEAAKLIGPADPRSQPTSPHFEEVPRTGPAPPLSLPQKLSLSTPMGAAEPVVVVEESGEPP
jgi:hypothetical protein